MNSIIQELWHGNIVPQEDSRTNSKSRGSIRKQFISLTEKYDFEYFPQFVDIFTKYIQVSLTHAHFILHEEQI